ncbi:hypothetical protein [Falsiroseomonas sp.]|uniref:hypothetical protein n=1 Tax=Falsiroseomonas sp. TaxID=2870721 RepID=UPI003564799B
MSEVISDPGIIPIKEPGFGSGVFAKLELGHWDEVALKFEGDRQELLALADSISGLFDNEFDFKFVTENSPVVTFIKFEPIDAFGDGSVLPQEIESLAGEFRLEGSLDIKFDGLKFYEVKLFDVATIEQSPPLVTGVDDLLG